MAIANILILLIPYLVILIVIPVLIGVYVYRDAVQRDMNAALWTLVAILAPAFIGFIIYLLVRASYSDLKCPSCAAQVNEQYTVCPKCGAKLKASCPNCRFPIDQDWSVCPKCATPLAENGNGYTPPARKKDTSLGKILLAVILIPILLLALLAGLSFSTYSIGAAINTAFLSKEHYAERPAITAWINACDEDSSKTYALHYQSSRNDKKTTTYLVYRPSTDQYTEIETNYKSGLFGANIEVHFNKSSDPVSTENQLFCVTSSSDKYAGLKVSLDGKNIDCEITEVDYNPALFEIIGEEGYSVYEKQKSKLISD